MAWPREKRYENENENVNHLMGPNLVVSVRSSMIEVVYDIVMKFENNRMENKTFRYVS